MLSQIAYPGIEQYTDSLNESIFRIQTMLQRGESRLGGHYKSARSHARKTCSSVVQIRILSQDGEGFTFTVHTGNVSSSGLSFLSPAKIEAEQILVGVPLSNQKTTWFKAVVARGKKIPNEEFWEYGVKFSDRLQ